MSEPRKIEYSHDDKGNITLPEGPPFDGKPVIIKLRLGWCEAWWDNGRRIETFEGLEYEGWEWVCMDAQFVAELDDAKWWMPLPETPDA